MLHQRLEVTPADAEKLDQIQLFLPGISPAEHSLRKRLLSARNVASAAMQATPPGATHDLFGMMDEAANTWLFKPATMTQLAEAVEVCGLLWKATQIAERLEGLA